MNAKSAIGAINRAGALLVFPMDNRREPASLWSHFFPRTPMRWEWDDSGDNRVGDLWHLRAELSSTGRAVYTKWYRGRATYFSRELFVALLRALNPGDTAAVAAGLSPAARSILRMLEGESPLSTKEIKRQAGLQGRAFEREYERAMRELWSRLLIVAWGEVDDGAFPSLAVGATRVLYEDLWARAWKLSPARAEEGVTEILGVKNSFYRNYLKLRAANVPPKGGPATRAGKRSLPNVIRFEDL